MRIDGTGYVGVGTVSPQDKIQLHNGNIKITDATGSTFRGLILGATESDTQDYSSLMWQASSGELRMNNNPVGFGGFTSFYTNASERMRITSAGDLGIKTTAPAVSLQVAGTTASSGADISKSTTSTTVWTDILTFTGTPNAYSVLLSTSENNYSQMWRVSGSTVSAGVGNCYFTILGDSGHGHAKDAEFRISSNVLQYKNVLYTSARALVVYDVIQNAGSFTH